MYVCGQIVGPQLVKTQTLKSHYPELWLGIIIRCVSTPNHAQIPTRIQRLMRINLLAIAL